NIGENRAALELELLLDGGINGDTQQVGGQHVAGELHPLKAAVEGPCEGLTKRRLPYTGNTFNEQVATGEQRNHGKTDDLILASNDLPHCALEVSCAMRDSAGRFRWH